ncbi:MAG: choice-of-anchor J domain-containing protein [Clostridiales bacterium]|nr:choice-of-anchor J domain-containing protein [Clostridiales bacterium]
MTRKLLSILIAVLMLVSVVPMGALANAADEQPERAVLSEIRITGYTEPEWGDNIAENRAKITLENASQYNFSCGWFTGSGSSMTELGVDEDDNYINDAVFDQAGEIYLLIMIQPASGNTWADPETVVNNITINGSTDLIDPDNYYAGWYENQNGWIVCTTAVKMAEPIDGELIQGYSFETQAEFDAWTNIAKGEGSGWEWYYDESSTYYSYEGHGSIRGRSYLSGTGDLNADDWFISPAIEVPENGFMTFWTTNWLSSYPDNLQVFVGETNDPDEMTAVTEVFKPGTKYEMKTVDLSDYAGKTVYVAFNHTGNGQYFLHVDLVQFWKGNAPDDPIPEDPTDKVITEVRLTGYVEPAAGEAVNCGIQAAEGANYYVPVDTETGDPRVIWYYSYEEDGMWSDYEEYGGTIYGENDRYRAYIEVVPAEGYSFAPIDQLKVYINDSEELVADKSFLGALQIITAYVQTGENDDPGQNDPNEIKEVKIVGFTLPEFEGTPDNKLQIGGVAYVDVTKAEWRTAEGVAVANFNVEGKYYQYIELTPIYDQFYFAEDVAVTINGNADFVASAVAEDGVLIVKTIEFQVGEEGGDADQYIISEIRLNGLVVPVWGEAPAANLTVPADANYTVQYPGWGMWDGVMNDDGTIGTDHLGVMEDGDVFERDDVYFFMYAYVFPASGYQFADEVTVYYNDEAVAVTPIKSYYNADQGCYVAFSSLYQVEDPNLDEPEDKVITEVNVINFKVPVWGETADTSGFSVPEGAHYTVAYDFTFWKYYGNGSGYPEYFNDATVYYYLQVAVTPEDGYTFADGCEFLLNGDASYVDASYNSYNASYNVYYTLSIDFTVEKPEGEEEQVIDTIEIIGYQDPVWGAAADVSGYTVPDDAHYYIDFNRTYWVAYDAANWDSYIAEYFDDEAIEYYLTCAIYPEDGYAFADDVTVLLGGSSDSYDDYYSGYNASYGYFRVYSIEFTVEDPNAITSIEINYVDPAWNATAADSEPTLPEDANYSIYEYAWVYEEGSDYGELADEDVFDNELARYYLYIAIMADEGLGFSSARTVVYINGEEYMIDPEYGGYYPDYGIYVVYTLYYTVVDPATLIAEFNFETDPEADGWKFVDKDNDHTSDLNWYWEVMGEDYSPMSGYQGRGLLTSASYVNGDGAYAPDNWAISPAIKGALYMSFYVSGQDANYAEEHFAVYAGTTARPDQMTEMLAETEATGEYIRYEIDLTDFAGQTIYIAFRHFNCEDMFRLNIDHVVLTKPIVWGDADMDCKVTAADSLLIMRYVQEIITEDDLDIRYLDVNADGKIDFVDALLVLRKAMDIYTDPFPAELPPEDDPEDPAEP